jgi:hypothetical protein
VSFLFGTYLGAEKYLIKESNRMHHLAFVNKGNIVHEEGRFMDSLSGHRD